MTFNSELEMGEVVNQINMMNEDLGRALEESLAQRRATITDSPRGQAITFLASLNPETGRLTTYNPKENAAKRSQPQPTNNEPTPSTSRKKKNPKCKHCKRECEDGNKYGIKEDGTPKEFYCLRCVMKISRPGDDDDIEDELNEFNINELEEIRKAKKAINKALQNQAETVTTPLVGRVFHNLLEEDRNEALEDLELLYSMEYALTGEIAGLDGTGTDEENLLLMDTMEMNEEKQEPEETDK